MRSTTGCFSCAEISTENPVCCLIFFYSIVGIYFSLGDTTQASVKNLPGFEAYALEALDVFGIGAAVALCNFVSAGCDTGTDYIFFVFFI